MSDRDTYKQRDQRKNRGIRFQQIGVASLTPTELRFIDEFMVDRKAEAAAIRAGYKPSKARARSKELLVRPEIQAEIARRDMELNARTRVNMEEIILELKRMAFFDIRSLFNPDGSLRKNVHELTEDEARALVNFDIITLDREGNYIVKLNPGNKLKALELLGKHLKMFTDTVQHTGTIVNYNADFGTDDEDED